MALVEPMPEAYLDFARDRPESAGTLRVRLATEDSSTWLQTVAWLMRGARVVVHKRVSVLIKTKILPFCVAPTFHFCTFTPLPLT